MNQVYINLKTNEIITPTTDGYIMCDSKIAHIILLLNQKGYKTKSSCSGHVEEMIAYDEKLPINARNFLDENPELQVIRETENEIIYRGITYSRSYLCISFENKYNFMNLPEGFYIEDDNNSYVICKEFKLTDENGQNNGYTIEEMKEIQENSIKELYEWVKNLENVKGDN